MPIVLLSEKKLNSVFNIQNIQLNNILRRFYAIGYDSILILKSIENKSQNNINGISGTIKFKNNFFQEKEY